MKITDWLRREAGFTGMKECADAADLLDECERALDDIANGTSHSDTCSYALTPETAVCDCHRAIANDTLAKLRGQEKAD